MLTAEVSELKQSLLDAIKANAMANGNLSIRGVAKLAEVDDRGILRGADFKSAQLGQKLTAAGFEGADLLKFGFPPEAVAKFFEHEAPDTQMVKDGAYKRKGA